MPKANLNRGSSANRMRICRWGRPNANPQHGVIGLYSSYFSFLPIDKRSFSRNGTARNVAKCGKDVATPYHWEAPRGKVRRRRAAKSFRIHSALRDGISDRYISLFARMGWIADAMWEVRIWNFFENVAVRKMRGDRRVGKFGRSRYRRNIEMSSRVKRL